MNLRVDVLLNDFSLGFIRWYCEFFYLMLFVEDVFFLIVEYILEFQIIIWKVNVDFVGLVFVEQIIVKEDVLVFEVSIVDGYVVVVFEDGNLKGVFFVMVVLYVVLEDGLNSCFSEG